MSNLVVHEYPDIPARTVGEPNPVTVDAIWQAVFDWTMKETALPAAPASAHLDPLNVDAIWQAVFGWTMKKTALPPVPARSDPLNKAPSNFILKE